MTKQNEGANKVEDFEAQISSIINKDTMLDDDAIKIIKEGIIKIAEREGNKDIADILMTIDAAVSKIKDHEVVALISSYILSKCPIAMQKVCIEQYNDLLTHMVVNHVFRHSNPIAIMKYLLNSDTNE
jgi:hypothetical protein